MFTQRMTSRNPQCVQEPRAAADLMGDCTFCTVFYFVLLRSSTRAPETPLCMLGGYSSLQCSERKQGKTRCWSRKTVRTTPPSESGCSREFWCCYISFSKTWAWESFLRALCLILKRAYVQISCEAISESPMRWGLKRKIETSERILIHEHLNSFLCLT